ncbi:hypothetical protein B0T11DRAFT_230502 [Plectosphaerella cucumerina]|uniref:Uncharacterized protein n=1 Tax=Plectosphaerella cucumerina TaxID=40658 RepID=A0A8K0TCM1_9PEZI|nr:hypothetical protein B0T11DRAFT_230502 [Plectosphaerella cucumerina]
MSPTPATLKGRNDTDLLKPTIIHQFLPPVWLENFYIRPNGQLLINSQSAPELYLLDPSRPDEKTLVHKFPNTNPGLTGLGGIVETTPDNYAIIIGDLNHTTVSGQKGSFSIWTISLEDYPRQSPRVVKAASLPEATFLNGLTTLENPTVILASDSYDGRVYRIDTLTGDTAVVVHPDDTTISPSGMEYFVGIDGIRVHRPRKSETVFLYYNNFMGEGYYRVPIDPELGSPVGPTETLATNLGLGLDDLHIDKYDASWISAVIASRIIRVDANNTAETVAESSDLQSVTAVRQGRTCNDTNRFYFVTGQGKVGFIDTSGWL